MVWRFLKKCFYKFIGLISLEVSYGNKWCSIGVKKNGPDKGVAGDKIQIDICGKSIY